MHLPANIYEGLNRKDAWRFKWLRTEKRVLDPSLEIGQLRKATFQALMKRFCGRGLGFKVKTTTVAVQSGEGEGHAPCSPV